MENNQESCDLSSHIRKNIDEANKILASIDEDTCIKDNHESAEIKEYFNTL